MPTYLSPGVYVEEISLRPGSTEDVQTSTAKFVDEELARSAGAAEIEDDVRRRLASDLVRVITAVLTSSPPRDAAPGSGDILVDTVDFPAFVANLIRGVFEAIVDVSVQQMQAYADLLAEVSKSVDRFVGEHASECEARDLLVRTLLAGATAASSGTDA